MKHFVDMHCHILPGIDDGASNEVQTAEMLEQAWLSGTRMMVATPHYNRRRGYTADQSRINDALVQARTIAKRINPNFRIYEGREIEYENDTPDIISSGAFHSMGASDYYLIEFKPEDTIQTIENGLTAIRLAGFRPILAHIDRYACMPEHSEYAKRLIDIGVVIQLNASTLLGDRGRALEQYAERLLSAGYIHLISSDAHDTDYRLPVLTECAELTERITSTRTAELLFRDNALNILKNQTVQPIKLG